MDCCYSFLLLSFFYVDYFSHCKHFLPIFDSIFVFLHHKNSTCMSERHREKRLAAWRYLLALPRSIYFNLKHLPIHQAWRLPVLVSHKTIVHSMSGKLIINLEKPKTGLVKIGFSTCQCSDFHHDRTKIRIKGNIMVKGRCKIGAGSSVEVAKNALLSLGDNFNLGPKSLIICHKEITFGKDVLTSWCCTIMDTDQHRLVDEEGNCTNPDRSITVGENVWLGCNVIVTKGTHLASNTTVSAGTRVSGTFSETMTVLSGNPATIVRRGLKREL